MALQSHLRAYGYMGPIDGAPGTNTYKAMQTEAQREGNYTGPIDGVMGINSWQNWGLAIHYEFFSN